MSKKAYYLIPFLILILAFTFSTCSKQTKHWPEYSNQVFEIKYPPHWELTTERNYEIELAPINEKEVNFIVFATGKIAPFSLENIKDKFIIMIQSSFEKTDIKTEEEITFNQHPAYLSLFTGEDERGQNFEGQLIIAKAEEELFGFLLIAPPDKYQTNIETVEAMLNTFELN